MEVKTIKQFSYTQGEMTLTFSVETTKPESVKDFLAVLERAVEDVKKEIKEI